MQLDFTSLEKAISQLKKSIDFCNSDLAKNDAEIFFQFRSASIQAFEYSFELSVKFIRRKLEIMETAEDVIDNLGYRDLIRKAAERGLLEEVERWFVYREKRNETSHTYDYRKAENIYKILPEFLISAEKILNNLKLT